jgi:hydrogenase maturation protein HypF
MKMFKMCPECQAEYDDPLNRRFHAQPNACTTCGPQLELWDNEGKVLTGQHNALLQAVDGIRAGKIVAIKGLGGFHLIVDARNDDAVRRLRDRKHREEKPFALMYPTLDAIKRDCQVSELEERLLFSPESPIVLLSRKQSADNRQQLKITNRQLPVTNSVAPNNPYLGVMLPYTPLYYILMKELGFPIVATSGNLSDEPICTDEHEAVNRLRSIADMFLVHNRNIVRHVDDSIVCVMMGRELVLRRARGYAPLPIQIKAQCDSSLLAVGAHLKNTIALASNDNIFISQHIGDLETRESLDAFHNVISDFKMLYETKPAKIICDLHPDYLSSKFARGTDIPLIEIQHHYAHIASCMAENQLEGDVLGVSWDGTGYGLDGTIWGGEFLTTTQKSFKRVATFRPFRLPGGEIAIKEPRRTAFGLLHEVFGNEVIQHIDLPTLQAFTPTEIEVIQQMLVKNLNSPITTSVGRLFDAVASIIGLRQIVKYEGQAAMELEFLTDSIKEKRVGDYRFETKTVKEPTISNQQSLIHIDWLPIVQGILGNIEQQVPHTLISVKFHNTLVEIIVAIAKQIGHQRIVLSGGCFQNRYLTERTVIRLREEGFRPYWHQRVPPNDGGISLGQVYAALRSM